MLCFAWGQETAPASTHASTPASTPTTSLALPEPTDSERAYVAACIRDRTHWENVPLPAECQVLVRDPALDQHDPEIYARVMMLQKLFRDMEQEKFLKQTIGKAIKILKVYDRLIDESSKPRRRHPADGAIQL